jgi:hypothetical protein
MIDPALRRLVRRPAGERCEYCHLPQHAIDLTFHVEHIVARQHGGTNDSDNLALACNRCNLYKGPNLSAIDPVTQQVIPLFHPRQDAWSNHFDAVGAEMVGKTPTGRATVELLRMNSSRRRELRERLIAQGRS